MNLEQQLNDIQNLAESVNADFNEAVETAKNDVGLSPGGVGERIQDAEDHRAASVAELRSKATKLIDRAKEDAKAITGKIIESEVSHGRAVLGDAIYTQLYMQEISSFDDTELLELYTDAQIANSSTVANEHTAFHAELLKRQIRIRFNKNPTSVQLAMALQSDGSNLSSDETTILNLVKNADRVLESLDIKARSQRLEGRYGIRAANFE